MEDEKTTVSKKISIFLILILIGFGLLVFNLFKNEEIVAGPGDNVWGWAWSENIGWISFNCNNEYDGVLENRCEPPYEDYGVTIDPATGNFSGYAWAGGGEDVGGTPVQTIGWINFAPAGPYPASPNYSARVDLVTGEVSGWARACTVFADPNACSGALDPNRGGWDGWIKLAGEIPCGGPVTFTYKGEEVTYGTVEHNGECWMDRNLGADPDKDPADYTGYDDPDAYGDLFQWGRLDDGHQTRTSGTTQTLSSTDVPGHSNFIYVPVAMGSPWDWRSPQNDDLWQGVTGTNNPCPSGWRIPTKEEWHTERASWSFQNYNGAFNSPLRLTAGGYRAYHDASLTSVGSWGYYWSSTAENKFAWHLSFYSSGAMMALGYPRSGGSSVRCIRDTGVSSYGVSLNTIPDPDEFEGWAWGGDDNNNEAVVGWISFNCVDRGVCGTSDYKVMTDLFFTPPNQPPYIEPGSVSSGEGYCNILPGTGQIGFEWIYKDQEGDDQSQYHLQIATDLGFTNKVVDCTSSQPISVDSPPDGGTGSAGVKVVNSPATDCSLLRYEIPYLGPGNLYYWRVRVKAETGNQDWSDWEEGPSGFDTPSHSLPWPMFTLSSSKPLTNEIVTFIQNGSDPDTNQSLCYSGGEDLCQNKSNATYSWDFGNGQVSSYKGNATTTYSAIGSYNVTLAITDDVGSCTKSKTVTIGLPLPTWIEVSPF